MPQEMSKNLVTPYAKLRADTMARDRGLRLRLGDVLACSPHQPCESRYGKDSKCQPRAAAERERPDQQRERHQQQQQGGGIASVVLNTSNGPMGLLGLNRG